MSKQLSFGVLEGVVVLDLTQMLAGPYCTMVLADHGADVIKIEPPTGDMSRGLGPFSADDIEKEQGGYFHSINRNKRSIALDLKDENDKSIFLQLIKTADVVVENFRSGVMDRLGLSYETLREINKKIVYAAIRGFGDQRTGESPYNEWPAFDIVAQAMGGFMAMTGPVGIPMKAGPGVGDIVPGLMAAFGIVAGVRYAEKKGEGQFVDVAMYDAMLALCERSVYRYSVDGAISEGAGNEHPLVNPFSVYESADGWIALGCPTNVQWHELVEVMDNAKLRNEERFKTNELRVENAVEVRAEITAWTSLFNKKELAEKLGGRVPFGPVNNIVDIFDDPHVGARDMLRTVSVPDSKVEITMSGVPVHYSNTPGSVRTAGPRLDEHRDEVLQQFLVQS
jgi:crotonobetainyl-CoA:carnitine CoA-transferase CaiB-like acyl-CoA transferase